jgi:hypothetical protein
MLVSFIKKVISLVIPGQQISIKHPRKKSYFRRGLLFAYFVQFCDMSSLNVREVG